MPQGIVKAPDTPQPPVLEPQPDSAQQTFSRLNEAAQRIAREDAVPNRRLPRASRLSPFRDISAEITRASTPLPNYARMHTGRNSQEVAIPDSYPGEENQPPQNPNAGQPGQWERLKQATPGGQGIQEASLPDFWPWFDNDVEEKESEDIWANRTDPLITRHKPNSKEAALIEQEDIRRALAEGVSTGQVPAFKTLRRKSPLRNIFIALAIFAIVALVIDGILLSALSGRSHSPKTNPTSQMAASLKLSTSQVQFTKNSPAPQQVQVQLSNFKNDAQVLLTRDSQEALQVVPGAALVSQSPAIVHVGANGSAIAIIIVTTNWGYGSHTIYAEDIHSQFTASASLLVIGATPSQPAHLLITSGVGSSTPLTTFALGPDIQGSITPKTIYLKNSSQSGSITWSASSNQSWLLISPDAGTFNQSQTIVVAVQRGNLHPGSYNNGVIKFYSNVDAVQSVTVTMAVTSPPPGTSVMALSPAALSFVTTDGSPAPSCQTMTISNPGSQPLYWSLTTTSSSTESTQAVIAHALGTSGSWLTISPSSPSSGNIPTSSYQQVSVCAQSVGLLPGAYLGALQMSAPGAADSLQIVSVSLTVQPHCGLVTTSGFLSFTAVQGKASAGSQGLGLNATASCNAMPNTPVNWTAQVPTQAWLSVNPLKGQINGSSGEYLTVSVNPAGLKPQKQPYIGFLVFSTQNSTQTVLISLLVQQPMPGAPVMGVAPLNLNFSTTQGQNPKGQVVTITNNGGSVLNWSSSAQPFSNSWLYVSAPTSRQVQPGQTGTATITVDTSKLSPGTYSGQVTLNGTDINGNTASGSPQVISVNLVVQPPCTLTQPSVNSLAFTGVQGGINPDLQPVLMTGTGNCAWPLLITATASSNASLLQPLPLPESIRGNGQSASLAIGPDIRTLPASTTPYTAQVTITATDSAGIAAQGSGQTISISVTVKPPCTFVSPPSSNLSFNILLGATSSTPQTVPLSETGTCAYPIAYAYNVKYTSGANWITVTPPVKDSGSGSQLGVNINATGLAPGSYSGQVVVTAADTNAISGALTITVTLTITAPTVSGTVLACTGAPLCLAPDLPIPGATVTVMSGTTTVATVTADASGNYSITTLPVGTYTINVSGTLSLITYTASSIPLTITGNLTGFNLQAY